MDSDKGCICIIDVAPFGKMYLFAAQIVLEIHQYFKFGNFKCLYLKLDWSGVFYSLEPISHRINTTYGHVITVMAGHK
jgi:hypothetical protein